MRVLSEEGRGEADRNVADCSSADTSAKRNDTHMSEGKGKKERHCIRLRRDCCCSSTSEGGLNTYLSLLSTCAPARTMTGVVSKIGAARVEVSSKEKRRRERRESVCIGECRPRYDKREGPAESTDSCFAGGCREVRKCTLASKRKRKGRGENWFGLDRCPPRQAGGRSYIHARLLVGCI